MLSIKNIIVGHNRKLPILADFIGNNSSAEKPLVIFCHGFKGFKDWGAWQLVAEKFAKKNLAFLKFNFSHNGTASNNPTVFSNLSAFAENTYSRELQDTTMVLDWINSNTFDETIRGVNIDKSKIYIIGHSRGGGIALTAALENETIKKVVTWASISTFNRFGNTNEIETWRKEGVKYIYNGRTKQNMPINFSFYKDYLENIDRLNLEKTAKQLKKPTLIIHGQNDTAVGVSHAKKLHGWIENSRLQLVKNANHVFESSHPYTREVLPKELEEVVENTIEFLLTK